MEKRQRPAFGMFSDIRRNGTSYLLVLPAMVYTFIFGYMTYPYILIAFQRFNYTKGIFHSEWVGLKNFEFFFGSSKAFTVTFNTIFLNLLFIVFGTLTALAISLILNELRKKLFVKISQSMMLFPNFISWIVISYVLYAFFSMDMGIVNKLLNQLGLASVNWYTEPKVWPTVLTVMHVWKGAGMSAIIYLATITGIDETLYEAAEIDGANRWQMCMRITIPLMMPTVVILMLLSVGKIMYGDFGMIYALIGDNGTLYSTTDIIDTYVFRSLRQIGDPSEAMAVGLFQSVIGFILVFGTNSITRKFFKDGALY
ncbi:ABC transporter permease subunit [Paenibacillus lautus]|uniref:ABC transporter permease n=1 Tax=Paenibacillus lautus TaxID=1401 RepID=UPI002DB8323C|nr:ABC transporter permease subunit [Paenibacillus lautus]MEC0257783.1 ABC transporter permease subunit [Paenibacillus lautus]MEC0309931.1 ABC transporter permease subunit [Paenibacillus lautus]